VGDATLHRFYVLHFLLPFILAAVSVVHLLFLHVTGSNNPLGVNRDIGRVPFHPFYTSKDLVGILIALFMMFFVRLLVPDLFLEPENYTPANPMVTPAHIKPEWYFLWVYAILRAVPNKTGGVVALLMAILMLLSLPFTDSRGHGCQWCEVKQSIFWGFVTVWLLLTWLGRCPAEEPFITCAQVMSVLYFSYFLHPFFPYLLDLEG